MQPSREYRYLSRRISSLSLSGKALIELMLAVHTKGLPIRFKAGGHSMTPFIRDGDVVLVHPLTSLAPTLGDVVAFIHPETKMLRIHRVLSVSGAGCLIQGDNMAEKPDGLVPGGAILGKVTRLERDGREVRLGLGPERILLALLSRLGMLAVIRRYLGPLHARFSRSPWPCIKS
jgi:hypothetical protein